MEKPKEMGLQSQKPPALTEEQKARFILAQTDEKVRNELVMENKSLINTVIRDEFYNLTLTKEEKDDLFQEGILVLMQLVVKFKPDLGYAFSTFAWDRIKWALMKVITKNQKIVDVPYYKAQRDLARVRKIKNLSQEENITYSDVAKRLGLSKESAFPIEISLNKRMGSDTGVQRKELSTILKDFKTPNPETIELARAELEKINNLIKLIVNELEDEDEKNVFFARYGDILNGKEERPVSPEKIVEYLNDISLYQVKSILKVIWRKIRYKLREQTSGVDTNDNWFLGILKQRAKLQETFPKEN